ncbi:MAG: sulfatase-like hydrolase/transferase, partial [Pirellulaceae bacterium]
MALLLPIGRLLRSHASVRASVRASKLLLVSSCLLLFCGTSRGNADEMVAGRDTAGWSNDLASENETIRLRAAKTLGIFGEAALPEIRKMLKHQDPSVRYWAASHCGNIGEPARALMPELKELAADPSTPIRVAASYALCKLDGAEDWSKPLMEATQTDDRALACCAGDFLNRLGPSAKSLLPNIESRHEQLIADKADYHIIGALKNAIRGIRADGKLEDHKRPTGGGKPRGNPSGPKTSGPKPRSAEVAKSKPNILWISCEDISPNLGCFGDQFASTPNLDQLASEGVRFTQAFTPAGVCAVVRTGIITGMYPISFGGQHMRSVIRFPDHVKPFPQYLREAGYFTSNKSKTDYQSNIDMDATWDRHGNKHSDWRDREEGQPFFSVINLTCSHESQIRHGEKTHEAILRGLKTEQRHNPDIAGAFLPPIHPDTPEARKDWAWYGDIISEMDRQAGEILTRLEEDGLAENTVVMFWSDHGRGLPRAKRWIYDSGVHVPVIVRWPGALEQGRANDDLVSTEDLTATTLAIAGVDKPAYMHGRTFIGPNADPAPKTLFFHRDRMDEVYEMMRAARNHRFKYIRNFEPERTYAQHIDYMDMMPTLVDLRRMNAAGELNSIQSRFFAQQKPIEELYDVVSDPHETVNLAGLPQFQ